MNNLIRANAMTSKQLKKMTTIQQEGHHQLEGHAPTSSPTTTQHLPPKKWKLSSKGKPIPSWFSKGNKGKKGQHTTRGTSSSKIERAGLGSIRNYLKDNTYTSRNAEAHHNKLRTTAGKTTPDPTNHTLDLTCGESSLDLPKGNEQTSSNSAMQYNEEQQQEP